MNAILTLALFLQGEGVDPEPGSGGLSSYLVPMLLIFVIFWVVMIGPERKQRKKREEMLGGLKKGDKVMTTSGLFGAVAQVKDEVVTLQVAEGVRMRFTRSAIQSVIDAEESAKDAEKEKAAAD